MTDTSKFKKTLAREILLFFGILAFTCLVWLFLFCRDSYYDNKRKSNQEKVNAINLQIDSLPFDKLKVLYEGINEDFVRNYSVNNVKYAIPKKEEQEFLKDYPTAKLLSPSSKGYSFYKPKVPLRILSKDSTLVFDFVALRTFRELVKENEYKDKLFTTFSQDYDLGTKISFDSKIETGLKFNDDVIKLQQKLLDEKQVAQNNLNSSKGNIKSNDEILKFLLCTLVILGIISYPIRLCIILLKWSFKTVRQNAT